MSLQSRILWALLSSLSLCLSINQFFVFMTLSHIYCICHFSYLTSSSLFCLCPFCPLALYRLFLPSLRPQVKFNTSHSVTSPRIFSSLLPCLFTPLCVKSLISVFPRTRRRKVPFITSFCFTSVKETAHTPPQSPCVLLLPILHQWLASVHTLCGENFPS